MKTRKCRLCKEREATEASHMCFDCAEETACEMASAGFSAEQVSVLAWGNPPKPQERVDCLMVHVTR